MSKEFITTIRNAFLPMTNEYLEKDNCPYCGCKEIKVKTYYEDGYAVEEIKRCKNCNATKFHIAYGFICEEDWGRHHE